MLPKNSRPFLLVSWPLVSGFGLGPRLDVDGIVGHFKPVLLEALPSVIVAS